jgi:hypothetical protein
MTHALKLERLDLTEKSADKILDIIKNFASEVGYSDDHINTLECRSRDGFIPNSHNYGGIECVSFRDQYHAYFAFTGFDNADARIVEYYNYDLTQYKEDKGIPKEQDLNEDQLEHFETEYRAEDIDATVLFSMDIMHTGIDDDGIHSIDIRICICVKDAPYHREYDDMFGIILEFKTAGELESQLKALLDRRDIKMLSENLNESY